MAVTAIISEKPVLEGDQFRVVLKLPAGLAQGVRTYFVPAGDSNILRTLAAAARPAKNNDAQIKTNLGLLQPGTEIDLADPVETPPTPSADDVVVGQFGDAVTVWLVQRAKLLIGVTDQATVDKSLGQVKQKYQDGTKVQQARFDVVLSLVRP